LREKASGSQNAAIDSALQRLAGSPTEDMGRLFKVVAVTEPRLSALSGFETAAVRC
jgi:SAM-dependent MidA family methyltransferase